MCVITSMGLMSPAITTILIEHIRKNSREDHWINSPLDSFTQTLDHLLDTSLDALRLCSYRYIQLSEDKTKKHRNNADKKKKAKETEVKKGREVDGYRCRKKKRGRDSPFLIVLYTFFVNFLLARGWAIALTAFSRTSYSTGSFSLAAPAAAESASLVVFVFFVFFVGESPPMFFFFLTRNKEERKKFLEFGNMVEWKEIWLKPYISFEINHV